MPDFQYGFSLFSHCFPACGMVEIVVSAIGIKETVCGEQNGVWRVWFWQC